MDIIVAGMFVGLISEASRYTLCMAAQAISRKTCILLRGCKRNPCIC
jgi:hypothetical protein